MDRLNNLRIPLNFLLPNSGDISFYLVFPLQYLTTPSIENPTSNSERSVPEPTTTRSEPVSTEEGVCRPTNERNQIDSALTSPIPNHQNFPNSTFIFLPSTPSSGREEPSLIIIPIERLLPVNTEFLNVDSSNRQSQQQEQQQSNSDNQNLSSSSVSPRLNLFSIFLERMRYLFIEDLMNRLFQMEVAQGPPPASLEFINSLPTISLDTVRLAQCNKCVICCEEFQLSKDDVVELPCKHFFDRDCIINWLKLHNTCPICRCSLPMATSNSSTQDPVERPLQQQEFSTTVLSPNENTRATEVISPIVTPTIETPLAMAVEQSSHREPQNETNENVTRDPLPTQESSLSKEYSNLTEEKSETKSNEKKGSGGQWQLKRGFLLDGSNRRNTKKKEQLHPTKRQRTNIPSKTSLNNSFSGLRRGFLISKK